MRRWVPALIGSTIGLVLSGYVLLYLPMHRNYEQCGHVTLCASAGEAGTATTPQSGVVHEHATAESGDAQTPTPSSRERK